MIQAETDARRYLDPAVLVKIGSLDLRARRLVEGFISGMHRSPYRGFSVEFAEHRKYSQGDDLRFLDWKVYGRTDKHYVKQYEQETNLHLLIAVDCSESMSYRSSGSDMSKREYATTIAAAIAYLALQQSDAVGVAAFDSKIHRTKRTSNHPAQWRSIIHELEQAGGKGTTSLRPVFDELAETLDRRHLVVILSDLLGDTDEVLTGLKHLRHRRHEPIVMQILDDAELTFPFTRATEFVGLEGIGPVQTEPRVIRDRYLAEVKAFLAALRRGCHDQRIDYELFNTRSPLSSALSAFLVTRSMRVGGQRT